MEKVIHGLTGPLGDIDFPLLQPLGQLLEGNIDGLDLVGLFEQRIGHGLLHTDARNLRHHIDLALDVLYVDRRVDVKALFQQLLHVLIPLRMAAARGIRVGKLVHQDDSRPPREDGVYVEFLQNHALVLDLAAGDHLQPVEEGIRLGPTMGLHDPHHHVLPAHPQYMRLLEHGVGLAHTRRISEKNLEPPPLRLLTGDLFQKRVRVGPCLFFGVVSFFHRVSRVFRRARPGLSSLYSLCPAGAQCKPISKVEAAPKSRPCRL